MVAGSCVASRSGSTITTAAINENCTLTVNVYDSIHVDTAVTGAIGGSQEATFHLTGGAGDKSLQWIDRLRSDEESRLTGKDADVLVTQHNDGSFVFAAEQTGRYTMRFRDDISGQITELSFDVLPYLAFSASRQLAQQDKPVSIGVWLSDQPIEYPVTVMLDRDALGQEPLQITFSDKHKLQQLVSLNATSSAAEAELSLSKAEHALTGSPATTILRITEQAVPLKVLLSSAQDEVLKTRIISRDKGLVTLAAVLKSGETAEFNWQSNIDLTVDGSSASFDPQTLDSGSYVITVEATQAERTGQAELTLIVVDSCPDDNCAGMAKGLPETADENAEHMNRLGICPATAASRAIACDENERGFIEVPNFYTLTLGTLSAEQSWQSNEFGTVLSDNSLTEDEGFEELGVTINFNVIDITAPGDIVPVAIPLIAGVTIPENAVWRKWINGQWQTFVEDDLNRIDSAPKLANGRCPVVSADSWTPGLSTGHGCVRLFIEDGGPNDDDGEVNGSIRDPGVLAVGASVTPPIDPPVDPEPTSPAETRSGGSVGGCLLVLLGILFGLREPRLRKVLQRVSVVSLAILGLASQATAQDWYLGTDALQIHSDINAGQVESDLAAMGFADTSVSIEDKSRQGFRLYGGWQMNSALAFELAWVDSNEITTQFDSLPDDVDPSSLKEVWPLSGRGYELSVLITPFTELGAWQPGARVGLWRMQSDNDYYQNGSVQFVENDETVVVLEAFTHYHFNPHWALKLGVSYYRVDVAPMNTIGIGLRYQF